MKNQFMLIITTIFVITLLFNFTGCKEPEPTDVTPPADVIELTVIASNGTALLSWTNPLDEDLAGIQISMNPAEGTLKNAISLGKGVSSFDVSGLENEKEDTSCRSSYYCSLLQHYRRCTLRAFHKREQG